MRKERFLTSTASDSDLDIDQCNHSNTECNKDFIKEALQN